MPYISDRTEISAGIFPRRNGRPRDPARVAVFLLFLITLLVMGPVCFDRFTYWDDNVTIRDNPTLMPPTLGSMRHHWTTPTMFLYVPITYTVWGLISWATQYTDASGHIVQTPWLFHAANLCVHLIAVVIVFRTLRLLSLELFACFGGALLFAIHPVQVEAVAWASGLKDVLSGALSLWALRHYLLYASSPDRRAARPHFIWAFVAFVAAMLAKASAMSLPLSLVAVDRLAAGRSWRKILLAAAAFVIAAIPLAIVARLVQDTTFSPHVPIWARPFIAADSIVFYLGNIAWPFHLIPVYDHSPAVVLAIGRCYWEWLIPAVIAATLVTGRRRRPLLLLAGLIFVFGCLPVLGFATSSFQYLSTTADHYLYFSMFGPSLAFAWLLARHPFPIWRSVAVFVLVACCVVSARQVGYWKNDDTLWARELAVNPNSFIAFLNIGIERSSNGDHAGALAAFDHAAQLGSLAGSGVEEEMARADLSDDLYRLRRLNDAIAEQRRMLAITHEDPVLHRRWEHHTAELGAMLTEAGRYADALPYLQTAHSIAPLDPRVASLLQQATKYATSQATSQAATRN